MKKCTNRLLALTLAACMCMGSVEMGVWAAEEESIQSEAIETTIDVETLQGGATEEVDVIITVTKENENVITDVKTAPEGDMTESGANVKYEENSEEADGTVTIANEEYTVDAEGYGASGGTEVTVTKGDGTEGDISMSLVKDKETQENISGTSGTAGEEITGDLKEENPAEYDQTKVTTTDRTATAEIGNSDSTTGIKPNRPSYNNKTENYTVGEDGIVEIEDEEVPLADAPETGDVAIMCLAAAAVSGLGFTGLTLKAKKNEDEE